MAREEGISREKTDAVQALVMAIFACGVYNRTEIGSFVPAKQQATFSDFFESTRQNQVLEPRTTVMIQIAAAFVSGCPT